MSNSDFINKYVAEHKKQLEELRVKANLLAFDGRVVIIGDDDYPQKRLQYATTSVAEEYVSPRIILYPTGEKDIQKAIGLCHELKMAISVRTGGHQYCGYSSTSPVNMQIDLSETFPEYEYDAETNVLRCGVSHALGSWAKMNHDHGIYLPMGVCAYVNLGGHVHTGGWGMVARSHGLLADRVLAFDIILANGEKERIVRPEAGKTTQHNDDVYYAVLGGSKGGDFGIVTH
jgi:FAD/FMN-containing dehydrogenase